ncbi:MAG TPA: Asp23/Gls24 family envelope stress response protein [Bacillota bacterium]|nr:Asp23/Gls24 family envelope stress response protein [Bacillota bacterium]HOR86936.1 Asp23/Gls24 family envelope stress response protein [Bacillota bacterium]HPL54599.1 Asp23/Gls24 family envelope stress response protein [Bacillota bacterium]
MSATYSTQYGEVNISDDVLATISGLAATECYGLVGMASKNAKDGLVELLKRENLAKGVRVTTEGEQINIDLYIVVEFGTKISTVADNIISKVKYTVENLTGLKVRKVNINVQGVRV